MSLATVPYCTREDVQTALDVAETARASTRIDRAIEAARDVIDGHLARQFVPWEGTKSFSWPDRQYNTPWILWLGRDEVTSVSAITDGGTTIPTANVYLEPNDLGPPYNRIEVRLDTTSAWAGAASMQRAIAVTGVFGYCDTGAQVGTLTSNLAASSSASPAVTWSDVASMGVGTLLKVDSERMLVTGRSMVDTTQTASALTASAADVSITVASGPGFEVGETILVDAERMRIADIAGNTLTVKRAWDGSVLATHAAATPIYALRGLTVTRAMQGTALAAHNTGAVVYRHIVPGLIRDASIGIALNQFQQEVAGYARIAGAGDNQREVSGRGLSKMLDQAMAAYGRQLRKRAV